MALQVFHPTRSTYLISQCFIQLLNSAKTLILFSFICCQEMALISLISPQDRAELSLVLVGSPSSAMHDKEWQS